MPKEYIDRDSAIEKLKSNCVGCESYGGVLCTACPLYNALLQLDMIPAADVVTVVHGEWNNCNGGNATCSHCKTRQKSVYGDDNEQRFCGHSGAKMKEGQ